MKKGKAIDRTSPGFGQLTIQCTFELFEEITAPKMYRSLDPKIPKMYIEGEYIYGDGISIICKRHEESPEKGHLKRIQRPPS